MTSLDPMSTMATNVASQQASNDPFPPTGTAFAVDADQTPLEGGTDPTYGTVKWRTLISGGDHISREFVLGIAEFEPQGTLLPHKHEAAEFYLGLTGSGVVTIDGEDHIIAPGTAIYLPCDVEHGVVAGEDGLRFAYGFAENAFEDVTYRFSAA